MHPAQSRRAATSLAFVVAALIAGCASSPSPPPTRAVVVSPARAAAPPASAPTQPPKTQRVVAREPTRPCDHGSGGATIDAFLDAARAQDLPSMLDCFAPEFRDGVAADAAGIVRQLVDRASTVASNRTLSVHTTMSFTNGVKEATISRTVELSVGENGATKPRTVTIRTREQPSGWFVVDVRDGVAQDPTFDALFAAPHAPSEVSAQWWSRGKDELVLSTPAGAATPPVGAQVDIFQQTQRSGGAAGTQTTLVGVASGTVKKAAGTTLHVDVKTWSLQPTKGGKPLVRGAPLVVQWRDSAAAAPP